MCSCKILGLTGPTGAGKSTVAEEFRECGCAVIDCDKLARDAVTQEDCVKKLCEAFGSDIVSGGVFNRALVAERAFSSQENAQKLNDITHPVILRLLREKIEENKKDYKLIVIDAPLLFEASLETWCDKVAAVTAPFDVRIERIMKRDGIGEEAARLRMQRQKDDDFYCRRADYIISGVSDSTRNDVRRILQDLQVII